MSCVCFFLPALEGGGAERVTLTIAAGLAERGHDVELVVGQRRGSLVADVPESLTVVDLGRPHVSGAFRALRAHLRQRRPDVLVSALFHANLAAVLAVRGLGVPVVVVEHNTMSAKVGRGASRRDQVAAALCGVGYRMADVVVAVSGGVADDMARRLRLSRSRIRVLLNPVDYAEVRRRAAEALEAAEAVGAEPLVLAVGRLTRQKDFATLLQAVALVPEVRLVVLGEGEERAALTKLAADLGVAHRVTLAGFVANPYPWFERADVIAMSSRWEGLPTVLLEALPFRARIVSTDCPSGPREILDGGRWGRLVPVGDVLALADAIRAAAAEPPVERTEAWARYDLPVAVSGYERLVESLHAGGARP